MSDFSLPGFESELRIAAVLDGELVGVASVKNPGRQAATLYQLFVSPNYRSKGTGRRLVEAACHEVKVEGSHALSAVVEHDGPLTFYGHLGFEVVHLEHGQTLVSKRL